jgi:homoserine dehydrogenase
VAGKNISMRDISIQNLVPEELRNCNSSSFIESLSKFDEHFDKLNKEALNEKCVLRYVGSINATGCQAILKKFPNDHPFASLKGSDNIISFVTKRFPQGLIVQGAGGIEFFTKISWSCCHCFWDVL